jgi:hypothetical protein
MVDWEYLDLALKNKTSYGGPSNIRVFAVQGFKSAGTSANCFQTNSALTVKDRRQYPISCSALMTTALDYCLTMSMN